MKNFYTQLIRSLLIVTVLVLLSITNLNATVHTLDLALSGQYEVPANPSPATGILTGTYDDATNTLNISLMFNGLLAPTTAAHFHGPAAEGVNGPVQVPLAGFPVGVTSGNYSNSFALTPEQESDLLCGMWYINIHTQLYPGGEIRSQLKEGTFSGNILTLSLSISGQQEVAPTPSGGTGILTGTYNEATNLLSFSVMFNGLSGNTTAAHIHGPAPAGINAGVQIPLVGFPAGVTSGSYANSYILTDALETHLLDGLLYLNIHTSVYPGGEIRGQLTEGTLTGNCGPEPIPVSNWALLLGGLLIGAYTFFIMRRRL
jgi:hypothetical protein